MTPRELIKYEDGEVVHEEYEDTATAIVRYARWPAAMAMAAGFGMGAISFFGGASVLVPAGGGPQATAPVFSFESDSVPCTFCSNWATATGFGGNAVTDGGQWEDAEDTTASRGLIMVTRDSLPSVPDHWPTNMLRLDYESDGVDGQSFGIFSEIGTQWTAAISGDTINYRFFLWNDLPVNGDIGTPDHGLESNAGDIEWDWGIQSPIVGDTFEILIGFDSGETAWRTFLPSGTPLRVEWRFILQSNTSAKIDVNIYDETISLTVPEWTDSDMECRGGVCSVNLEVDDPTRTFISANNAFARWRFGVSGQAGALDTLCCVYQAAPYVSIGGAPILAFVPSGGN